MAGALNIRGGGSKCARRRLPEIKTASIINVAQRDFGLPGETFDITLNIKYSDPGRDLVQV